jgi:C-5 cytosine-specific DNA methylase
MVTKGAYYNEIDEYAAEWLENLIAAGHIADGVVDRRSITDVSPDDLKGFTQCHFFAGIGVWSYALRLAGWDDDRPVWTGSCPCQPFSSAGEGKGFNDERHLWPEFYRLIEAVRPKIIFGEQVAAGIAIGPSAKVQKMRRKEVDRILSGAPLGAPMGVPYLRKSRDTTDKTLGDRQEATVSAATSKNKTGFLPDERCEKTSEGQRTSVQLGLAGDTDTYRTRHLRSDRNPLQSGNSEKLGRTVVGPDTAARGVHQGKHTGSSLRTEHDDEHLGYNSSTTDSRRDTEQGSVNERDVATNCESVEPANQKVWIDAVFDDLESTHYSCGAAVFPACGIGAPHIRSRLYWVADANGRDAGAEWQQRGGQQRLLSEGGGVSGLGNATGPTCERVTGSLFGEETEISCEDGKVNGYFNNRLEHASDSVFQLANTASARLEVGTSEPSWSSRKEFGSERLQPIGELDNGRRTGPTNGFWGDADWLFCRDGKWRPVRPKTFPLVNGATSRMGRLRAYGNAINAHQARGFIESVMLSTDAEPRTVLSEYADIADLL